VAAGAEPPGWAREALPRLPDAMSAAGRRSGAYERACVDLVEAVLLRERVGERFRATVVDVDRRKPSGTVTIPRPAVRAHCEGDGLELGTVIDARLVEADPARRAVRFAAGA
jgi:exoribonuclease R